MQKYHFGALKETSRNTPLFLKVFIHKRAVYCNTSLELKKPSLSFQRSLQPSLERQISFIPRKYYRYICDSPTVTTVIFQGFQRNKFVNTIRLTTEKQL